MSANASRIARRSIIKIHRWLSICAAAFWLVQAVTGAILSFHFEIEDALIGAPHRPTDFDAIESRIGALASSAPDAKAHWIWTTAGLPDRYIILYTDGGGVLRRAYIDGAGEIHFDRAANNHTFLSLMREIHLTFLSGDVGHWILAVTGVLLVTNLIFGLVAAWPRKRMWRQSLTPATKGPAATRLYSWHRAIGLWAVLPMLLVVGAGTLILFDSEMRFVLGAEKPALADNPPTGPGVGFAAAARAAENAIPGGRFIGTTLPSEADASYHATVRAPGELYRGGYGGSTVVVNANDASIRFAYSVNDASAAEAFLKSLYPIHTGEFAGLPGRVIAMTTGIFLSAMIVLGIMLWLKRRTLRKPAASIRSDAASASRQTG